MPLVVFLRGVNVGGHRTFRPTRLARKLESYGVVNVGAAGTFVVRKPPGRRVLRAKIACLLPFPAEILICEGREVRRLLARDFFARRRVQSLKGTKFTQACAVLQGLARRTARRRAPAA